MRHFLTHTAVILTTIAMTSKAMALVEPDSIHNYQYINKIYLSDPEKATVLADEAVELDMMEQYLAWYVKSVVSINKGQYKEGSAYLTKAINNDKCKQDKTIYINCLSYLTNLYRIEGNLEDAIRISTEGLDFARQEKNMTWEGQFLTNMGLCLLEMGKDDEGFERFRMAEEVFDNDIAKNESINSMRELVSTLYYLMHSKSLRYNDTEALRAGLKYEQTVLKIMDTHLVDTGYADIHFSQVFPIIAFTYERLGNHKDAEKYFKKWEALNNSKNTYLFGQVIPYLALSKQYDKALAYSKKHIDEQPFGDTICMSYVTALAQYREILDSIGDYKNAFNTLKREMVIQDSIYKREKHQISIEMATAYQVKEKEAATALAQQKVKWMSAVIVLLIIIIVSTITYSVITIRRTKALARSIKERIDNEDLRNSGNDSGNTTPAETASTEPVQDSNASDTNYKALFKKMDEQVKSEKLYLNPNLQRDDLAKMVNISKNDFANFIQQNAGCNTNTYINNLRLEYAVRTLVHEPEYKISAVAELSGIPNLSTFYRLFTERYGITPVKFAKNIAAN